MSQEFSEKLDLGDNALQRSTDLVSIGAENNVDQNASLAEVYFHHDQNGATSSSRHVKDEAHSEKVIHSSLSKGKSSLRNSGVKKLARSVTWADSDLAGGNLCEFREFENTKEGPSTSRSNEAGENDGSERFASAEACAMALIQAAEAVASGQSDANDAGMNLHSVWLLICNHCLCSCTHSLMSFDVSF